MGVANYFVSDLHLFSRRSLAPAHERALHAAANKAGAFVLGGDIFDFRWSMLHSTEATVDAGIRWLDELVGSHKQTEFHYILGNHDSNERFVAALHAYSRSVKNLQYHPYYLRMGRNVFLHGDAADRPLMCADRLRKRREHWGRDERRGQVRNMLYDLAVNTRLHKLAGKVVHPRKQVAGRVLGYLHRVGQGPMQGVEHVYFGHTHDALCHYRHDNVMFHNGGAPIAGLDFRIVPVTV
jgi:UDP-2,3-diacylglucosamine hydrolase